MSTTATPLTLSDLLTKSYPDHVHEQFRTALPAADQVAARILALYGALPCDGMEEYLSETLRLLKRISSMHSITPNAKHSAPRSPATSPCHGKAASWSRRAPLERDQQGGRQH